MQVISGMSCALPCDSFAVFTVNFANWPHLAHAMSTSRCGLLLLTSHIVSVRLSVCTVDQCSNLQRLYLGRMPAVPDKCKNMLIKYLYVCTASIYGVYAAIINCLINVFLQFCHKKHPGNVIKYLVQMIVCTECWLCL